MRYGGLITMCGATLEAREKTADRMQQETGAIQIHPFNDPRIIRFPHISFIFCSGTKVVNHFFLVCPCQFIMTLCTFPFLYRFLASCSLLRKEVLIFFSLSTNQVLLLNADQDQSFKVPLCT